MEGIRTAASSREDMVASKEGTVVSEEDMEARIRMPATRVILMAANTDRL